MITKKKKRIVIAGGGISGLSLAWFLKQRFKENIDIKILEASKFSGGWIRTHHIEDVIFEEGPRSFRGGYVALNTLKLIESLCLEDEVIVASKEAKIRYLYKNGKLQPIPNSLRSFFKHPDSFSLIKALWHEWKTPCSFPQEESIKSFFDRRFGAFITENFIDPLVSGIYAGDINTLSVKACFPKIFHMEKTQGSIVKGLLKNAFKKKQKLDETPFVKKMIKFPLFSFKEGMDTLTKSLHKQFLSEFQSNCKVININCNSETVLVETDTQGTFEADHLFLALPIEATASILRKIMPNIAEKIEASPSATVAVVNLGWQETILKNEGFGYLIPSGEKQDILGVVFDSSVFPQQNSHNVKTRLTVMMGGIHQAHIKTATQESLVSCALNALSRHLSIEKKPDIVHVKIANNAIPQYEVGHNKKKAWIEQELLEVTSGRIQLVGSSWYGVSIHDCISNAKQIASEFHIN